MSEKTCDDLFEMAGTINALEKEFAKYIKSCNKFKVCNTHTGFVNTVYLLEMQKLKVQNDMDFLSAHLNLTCHTSSDEYKW